MLAHHLQDIAQAGAGAALEEQDLRVVALLLQQLVELQLGGLQQLEAHGLHLRDVGELHVTNPAEHRLRRLVGIAVVLHGQPALAVRPRPLSLQEDRSGGEADDGRQQQRGRRR